MTYTVAAASDLLGVPQRTIRHWISTGKIRARKKGHVTHVHPVDVEIAAAHRRTRRAARPRYLTDCRTLVSNSEDCLS